jgi:hypothetical protein
MNLDADIDRYIDELATPKEVLKRQLVVYIDDLCRAGYPMTDVQVSSPLTWLQYVQTTTDKIDFAMFDLILAQAQATYEYHISR